MPLHIEKELNAMLDRSFSPELVEKLVACRQARWKARGHIDNEKREPLLWAALTPLLTPQQKDTLEATSRRAAARSTLCWPSSPFTTGC